MAGLLQAVFYYWGDNPNIERKFKENDSGEDASKEKNVPEVSNKYNSIDIFIHKVCEPDKKPIIVEITEDEANTIKNSLDNNQSTVVNKFPKCYEAITNTDVTENTIVNDYVLKRHSSSQQEKHAELLNLLTITDNTVKSRDDSLTCKGIGIKSKSQSDNSCAQNTDDVESDPMSGLSLYDLSLDIVDWCIRQLTDLAFFVTSRKTDAEAMWFPETVAVRKGTTDIMFTDIMFTDIITSERNKLEFERIGIYISNRKSLLKAESHCIFLTKLGMHFFFKYIVNSIRSYFYYNINYSKFQQCRMRSLPELLESLGLLLYSYFHGQIR